MFVSVWAAALFGMVRSRAGADDVVQVPSPLPSPSTSPGPAASKGAKAHVHGPNGITSLPEHRPIGWKMEVLDGPPFDLNAYRGKVVFINIFATWCGPCNKEQPGLVAFARAHPDDTVVVGMDYTEIDDKVREYRKKFDIPYPIAMDRRGNILRGVYKGGDMAFPMTIVFRPDGTLSCAWEGNASPAFFEREREYALSDPDAS